MKKAISIIVVLALIIGINVFFAKRDEKLMKINYCTTTDIDGKVIKAWEC